ncbi:MAG: helix-turn-helix transcriptional regulator [Exilibacterium sp.]
MAFESPFHRRLKEARMRKDISQKELGIRAGIHEFSASPRMNQYERGIHVPDLQTAQRIAEQLDIPSCFLYCQEDDVASLVMKFSQLDAGHRKQVLEDLERRCTEHEETKTLNALGI